LNRNILFSVTVKMAFYRLGDVVAHYDVPINPNLTLRQHTVDAYPGSIGAKYVLATKDGDKVTNMNILGSIVTEHCKDIQGPDVAIHVRVGDAFEPKHRLMPPTISDLKNICEVSTTGSRTLYSGIHNGWYQHESREYIGKASLELNAHVAAESDADTHFCEMLQSKMFVQGRGGYSGLIRKVRNHMNYPSVCDESVSGKTTNDSCENYK